MGMQNVKLNDATLNDSTGAATEICIPGADNCAGTDSMMGRSAVGMTCRYSPAPDRLDASGTRAGGP
jgi:hypothetical protein